MEAAAAATVVSTLASTYFTYDNIKTQKKATKAAKNAANYQAELERKTIQDTLAEQQRKSRNLLAQQQSAYKAKLGAGGLSHTSGSGQVILDSMQKEYDMEDKYLQDKASISLDALRNSIDKLNTQNLLQLRTLSNNQIINLANGVSGSARQMLK